MATLLAAVRNKMPKNEFTLPGKRAFPIPDKSHAIQALRMKGDADPAEQTEVTDKVKSKLPTVGIQKQKTGLMQRLTGK